MTERTIAEAGEAAAGSAPLAPLVPVGWNLAAASPADIEAWVTLVESAYRGDESRRGWTTEADLLGGNRLNADIAANILTTANTTVLLLRDPEGNLVGSVQLERQDDGVAYFGLFAISPTRQGDGLGTRLMRAAQEWARTRWSATHMRMTVISRRAELIAYYRRKGWELTGQTSPFPYDQPEVGMPKVDDLEFVELATEL